MLAAIVLVLIGAGWLGLRLYRVWGAAAALRADADAGLALVEDDLHDVDPHEAASLLGATRADLLTFESAARPFLWVAPHLGWVPRWGPTIEAAPMLLDIALELNAAGEQVVDALMPILQNDVDDGLPTDRSLISEATAALAHTRPQLGEALDAVEEAQAARDQLEVEALVPRLQGWMARLDRYLPLVEEEVRGMLLAPEALGAEGPRTYLLLLQNEDELRATGGLISGVAQITLSDGKIQKMQFEDSYAIDDFSNPYPEPPAALRETMLGDLWLFRDSNWSPDFPTSAKKAIELYQISRDVAIDGVVALDQRAISLLLEPLGPLDVEGADEPITGQNVVQIARRAWAPGEEIESDWWRQRKSIMGSVLDAAVLQLEGGLEHDQLVGLGQATLEALRQRHLMFYLDDPTTAKALHELGWDGAVTESPGDFLMVVDSNVGFNKVNAAVERQLGYTVDLTDPSPPEATLTVHHHHPVEGWTGPCSQEPRYSPTYQGMIERCYFNYLRVYVLPGAELLRATAHPVAGDILLSGEGQPGEVDVSGGEAGKTVFSTFLVVKPSGAMETVFVYSLPYAALERSGNEWQYRLSVQKQPGTDAPGGCDIAPACRRQGRGGSTATH